MAENTSFDMIAGKGSSFDQIAGLSLPVREVEEPIIDDAKQSSFDRIASSGVTAQQKQPQEQEPSALRTIAQTSVQTGKALVVGLSDFLADNTESTLLDKSNMTYQQSETAEMLRRWSKDAKTNIQLAKEELDAGRLTQQEFDSAVKLQQDSANNFLSSLRDVYQQSEGEKEITSYISDAFRGVADKWREEISAEQAKGFALKTPAQNIKLAFIGAARNAPNMGASMILGPYAGIIPMANIEAKSFADEAKRISEESGIPLDPNERHIFSAIYGVIAGAIENWENIFAGGKLGFGKKKAAQFGIDSLKKIAGKTIPKRVLDRIVGAVSEGGEEVAQGLLQNKILNIMFEEEANKLGIDYKPQEFTTRDVGQAFAGGASAALVTGGVGAIAENRVIADARQRLAAMEDTLNRSAEIVTEVVPNIESAQMNPQEMRKSVVELSRFVPRKDALDVISARPEDRADVLEEKLFPEQRKARQAEEQKVAEGEARVVEQSRIEQEDQDRFVELTKGDPQQALTNKEVMSELMAKELGVEEVTEKDLANPTNVQAVADKYNIQIDPKSVIEKRIDNLLAEQDRINQEEGIDVTLSKDVLEKQLREDVKNADIVGVAAKDVDAYYGKAKEEPVKLSPVEQAREEARQAKQAEQGKEVSEEEQARIERDAETARVIEDIRAEERVEDVAPEEFETSRRELFGDQDVTTETINKLNQAELRKIAKENDLGVNTASSVLEIKNAIARSVGLPEFEKGEVKSTTIESRKQLVDLLKSEQDKDVTLESVKEAAEKVLDPERLALYELGEGEFGEDALFKIAEAESIEDIDSALKEAKTPVKKRAGARVEAERGVGSAFQPLTKLITRAISSEMGYGETVSKDFETGAGRLEEVLKTEDKPQRVAVQGVIDDRVSEVVDDLDVRDEVYNRVQDLLADDVENGAVNREQLASRNPDEVLAGIGQDRLDGYINTALREIQPSPDQRPVEVAERPVETPEEPVITPVEEAARPKIPLREETLEKFAPPRDVKEIAKPPPAPKDIVQDKPRKMTQRQVVSEAKRRFGSYKNAYRLAKEGGFKGVSDFIKNAPKENVGFSKQTSDEMTWILESKTKKPIRDRGWLSHTLGAKVGRKYRDAGSTASTVIHGIFGRDFGSKFDGEATTAKNTEARFQNTRDNYLRDSAKKIKNAKLYDRTDISDARGRPIRGANGWLRMTIAGMSDMARLKDVISAYDRGGSDGVERFIENSSKDKKKQTALRREVFGLMGRFVTKNGKQVVKFNPDMRRKHKVSGVAQNDFEYDMTARGMLEESNKLTSEQKSVLDDMRALMKEQSPELFAAHESTTGQKLEEIPNFIPKVANFTRQKREQLLADAKKIEDPFYNTYKRETIADFSIHDQTKNVKRRGYNESGYVLYPMDKVFKRYFDDVGGYVGKDRFLTEWQAAIQNNEKPIKDLYGESAYRAIETALQDEEGVIDTRPSTPDKALSKAMSNATKTALQTTFVPMWAYASISFAGSELGYGNLGTALKMQYTPTGRRIIKDARKVAHKLEMRRNQKMFERDVLGVESSDSAYVRKLVGASGVGLKAARPAIVTLEKASDKLSSITTLADTQVMDAFILTAYSKLKSENPNMSEAELTRNAAGLAMTSIDRSQVTGERIFMSGLRRNRGVAARLLTFMSGATSAAYNSVLRDSYAVRENPSKENYKQLGRTLMAVGLQATFIASVRHAWHDEEDDPYYQNLGGRMADVIGGLIPGGNIISPAGQLVYDIGKAYTVDDPEEKKKILKSARSNARNLNGTPYEIITEPINDLISASISMAGAETDEKSARARRKALIATERLAELVVKINASNYVKTYNKALEKAEKKGNN